MRVIFSFIFGLILFLNGGDLYAQETTFEYTKEDSMRKRFTTKISKARLKKHVEILAADSMKGRKSGTIGQKRAMDYLVSVYQEELNVALDKEDFLQKFEFSGIRTENILLQITGSTYPDEYIVVSAHYDHMGQENKKIYNGADDNASGSAALLEMVRVFQFAVVNGYQPKRSIVFVHFSAEELGLWGSYVFMKGKILPYPQIKANLNADMIGRVDKLHRKNEKYVYVIGSDYFSDTFDSVLQEVNSETDQLELSYRFNSTTHSEQFFRRTDSFNFSVEGIPFIFFTSGTHKDYHQPSDTADKIEYDMLTYRTRLLFAMTWELANNESDWNIDAKKVKQYQSKYKR